MSTVIPLNPRRSSEPLCSYSPYTYVGRGVCGCGVQEGSSEGLFCASRRGVFLSRVLLSETSTTESDGTVVGRSGLSPPPNPYTRVFTSVNTRVLNGVKHSGFHVCKHTLLNGVKHSGFRRYCSDFHSSLTYIGYPSHLYTLTIHMGKTKRDEHGEYDPDSGSKYPIEEDDVSYTPCNAVLKFTFERYGERRYCSGMAVSNFGDAANYDNPDFCKHHQSRKNLMKQHEDQYKTGAYAKSHEHKFQHMPPHKRLIANDLYKSLLKESSHAFDEETVKLHIDVEGKDFAGPEVDTLVLDHPIPQAQEMRGKALWHAALDFVTMESIREEQFRVAAEETYEGRELAIGETTTVVSVTEDGREITDTDEHHLNLPLSRIQKDYKEHMKFGGVSYDADEEDGSMGTREWVLAVEPDEEQPAPETTGSDTSPLSEVEIPDDE